MLLISKIVEGNWAAQALCRRLAAHEIPFQFNPLPDDQYEFVLQQAREDRLNEILISLQVADLPFDDVKDYIHLRDDERAWITSESMHIGRIIGDPETVRSYSSAQLNNQRQSPK